MGRGGGSSGGGSFHSGGSGHYHYGGSSGGRSGRSSSSSSSRGSGGYRSSRNSTTVYHMPYYGGRYHQPATSISVLGGVFSMFIFLAVILACCFIMFGNRIEKSTHEREKLSRADVQLVDTWYSDEFGDWIYDESALVKGMRKFYDKTGVQPYLLITDNIAGNPRPKESDFNTYLGALYDSMFIDDGHAIVCFLESSPSDWAVYVYAGPKAKQVLDDEGREIMLDYFDYYYTSSLSEEEFFSTVFVKSADRMMSVQKTTKQLAMIAGIVFIIGSAIALTVFLLFRNKVAKAKLAEANAKVLNADVDQMADSILDKYNT